MKRKMFRKVAVLLLISLMIPFLNGCANTSPNGDNKESQKTVLEESVNTDEAENTEVISNIENKELFIETTNEEEFNPYTEAKKDALYALYNETNSIREDLYVYKDFGLSENHFTQKAKMAGKDDWLVKNMNENWQEDPYSGTSCIRCRQTTVEGDWGGWMFLNGYLPAGSSIPRLNDGTMDNQGLDLTGADELCFYAKGENGGERIEFFTCGFGYDGETGKQMVNYPDSCKKCSTGWITLTDEWEEYSIPLGNSDLSYIVCGFGYVMNDRLGHTDSVFYLDEIRFTGYIEMAEESPVMLRSYDTENIYIQNAAFSYDNALVAMAYISEGMQDEAKDILDAFVYAIKNDRKYIINRTDVNQLDSLRVRNAYAAGIVTSISGWESGVSLPGWYDNNAGEWYEDRYQVGSNVGNTSYVALALLQYYNAYGDEEYLETAQKIMNWVIENCSDDTCGFTAGFDGWEEGNSPVVYPFTYKSIEHNIDAYAAFSELYKLTNETKYKDAAQNALDFIKSMYDEDLGLFYTGTGNDGVTPNKSVIVLDAQVWCAMALGDEFEPYQKSLETVEKMKTAEGTYPFCLENKNGGWWSEGTAYTALMYRQIGDNEKYEEAMNALVSVQDGGGMFHAATVDNLSTGMDLFTGEAWVYTTDLHIAPTAWFIMASNDFNPYSFE